MNKMVNKNVNNIKTLVVDMIEKANSGHPGAPLGLATFVYTLYKEYLVINPDNDKWNGRDIFILSNGHACALQYVMNYLLGFLQLQDLKKFRQLNSLTPGHPEGKSYGIEVTTGPLGQGIANAVGFAISLKKQNCTNKVYCIFGDGCYMEGIGQESFSIAANLKLDNITFIYDYNKTTIDGHTELCMNENVEMRFNSLGYTVIPVQGEDICEIRKAIEHKTNKPKVIILHTIIGRDSVVENTSKAHGSPLGVDGVNKLKKKYDIPLIDFYVSEELKTEWEAIRENKRIIVKNEGSNEKMQDGSYVDKERCGTNGSCNYNTCSDGNGTKCDINVDDLFVNDEIVKDKLATRKAFSIALDSLKHKDNVICGSADLVTSCLNKFSAGSEISASNYNGNYINFGVREHAMFGIANGISAHGYYTPIFSTFLNFVSYGYPAVRLGAFNRLNNIYVLTHDSICLGEDGPTHQPIEVLLTLRSTPNLYVMRPCDIKECRGALAACFSRTGPKAIILSRQKLPLIEDSCEKKCQKGAYYLTQYDKPDIILVSTGSEIELCYKIVEKWNDKKIAVVSLFSWEMFEEQSADYKDSILLKHIPKISIEASTTYGWHKYTDYQIGIDRFGWSGKCEDVYAAAGFTPEAIIENVRNYLDSYKSTHNK